MGNLKSDVKKSYDEIRKSKDKSISEEISSPPNIQ
jgi:hypothetical protein